MRGATGGPGSSGETGLKRMFLRLKELSVNEVCVSFSKLVFLKFCVLVVVVVLDRSTA